MSRWKKKCDLYYGGGNSGGGDLVDSGDQAKRTC